MTQNRTIAGLPVEPVVLVPEPVAVANSGELIFDDGSECFSRPARRRFHHAGRPQVHVVDVSVVQCLHGLYQLKFHKQLIKHDET